MSKLSGLTVSDLPKQENLLTVLWDDPVSVGFQKLFDSGYLSAPVLKDDIVVGLVDLVDVVVFSMAICKTSQDLVKIFGLEEIKPTVPFADLSGFPSLLNIDEMAELISRGVTIDSSLLVSNFSKSNPLKTVDPTTSISDLVDLLSQHHRVVVLEGEKLVGYVTQSDLVKFLHSKNLFGELTLHELGMGSCSVASVSEDATMIEAFKIMAMKRTAGVAILDNEGRLVGNISSQDVRGISASADFVLRLYLPYDKYVESLASGTEFVPRGFISVTSEISLSEVVDRLLQTKRHHAYIVENEELKGVVSLGDILRLI